MMQTFPQGLTPSAERVRLFDIRERTNSHGMVITDKVEIGILDTICKEEFQLDTLEVKLKANVPIDPVPTRIYNRDITPTSNHTDVIGDIIEKNIVKGKLDFKVNENE